jgi:hypothetical protein
MTNKFSIYAGEPLIAALDAIGERYAENRSGRINTIAERYMAMIADEISRLTFSRNDWCAILDANNGVQQFTGIGEFPSMIWANVHDTPELGKKWDIDQADLVRRLQALPRSSLLAVQEVADRFWSRSEKPTDKALKEAGVKLD